jgi:hypothetical protein
LNENDFMQVNTSAGSTHFLPEIVVQGSKLRGGLGAASEGLRRKERKPKEAKRVNGLSIAANWASEESEEGVGPRQGG